jgi:outer membrane protein insertion porin family
MLRRNELGNPVGGRSSLCGSLEGRIDLVGNLELTLFVDAGRLSDLQTAGVSDDVRFSAGLGLRYITPIGPMGLVYGYKLNREPGESAGRIHIAIGYTF